MFEVVDPAFPPQALEGENRSRNDSTGHESRGGEMCGVVGGRWGHGWGRGAVGAMSCAGQFALVAISAIRRRLQVSFFLAPG